MTSCAAGMVSMAALSEDHRGIDGGPSPAGATSHAPTQQQTIAHVTLRVGGVVVAAAAGWLPGGVAGSVRALRVPPGSADGVDQAAYAAVGEVGVAGGAGRDGRDRADRARAGRDRPPRRCRDRGAVRAGVRRAAARAGTDWGEEVRRKLIYANSLDANQPQAGSRCRRGPG